jgi:hypothetical protein
VKLVSIAGIFSVGAKFRKCKWGFTLKIFMGLWAAGGVAGPTMLLGKSGAAASTTHLRAISAGYDVFGPWQGLGACRAEVAFMEGQRKLDDIVIPGDMRAAIGCALDLAFQDQEHWLEHGSPTIDYGREWARVRFLKAEEYRELSKLGARLGFDREADRWKRLAENVEAIEG